MPFDVATYLELLRRSASDRPRGVRLAVVAFAAVGLPLWWAFCTLCLWLDRLCFPGLDRVEIREPLFIVGHARSGTTLMHRLACLDAEHASAIATWEMLLPSLLQKRAVLWLARVDARLGAPAARRIRAFEDRAFAKGRQMHPMGLTQPEEDEFVFLPTFGSATLAMLFPYQDVLDRLAEFDRLPARRRRRYLAFYRGVVQRQLRLNGTSRRHTSKNTVFVGKLRSLAAAFPDAKFVILLRNPCEAIPSLQKMMERNWKATRCPREAIARGLERLAERSYRDYEYAVEVADELPAGRCALVSYTDLVAHPAATVTGVWRRLGLPVSDAFAAALTAEEARSRGFRSEHAYRAGEFGLSRAAIAARLAPLFERFGWEA